MPKFGVHKVVLDRSKNWLNTPYKEIITNNIEYANLGAIGPDLFFFGTDYEAFNFILNICQKLDSLYDDWMKIIYPLTWLKEQVEEINEALLDVSLFTILGGVDCSSYMHNLLEAKDRISGLTGKIGTILFPWIGINLLTNIDGLSNAIKLVFEGLFTPHLQRRKLDGSKFLENEWYWFDILHYRKTGEFAHNLINNAGNDPQKLAYAYGYLTHIATDVVGHGYVNEIVGGPYRTHVWRHITVENFIDSWVWDKYKGKNINCGFYDLLNISALGNKNGFSGEAEKLIDFLRKTFEDTYNLENSSKYPELLDIDETFGNFAFCQKILSDCIKKPLPPFENFVDFLPDFIEALVPPSPPSGSGVCSFWEMLTDIDCWENLIDILSEWFNYLVELIKWAIDLALSLIDFLIGLYCEATFGIASASLYLLETIVYEIYMNMHYILVLNGILIPHPDQFMGTNFETMLTSPNCPPGNFPHRKANTLNLECPDTPVEYPYTCAPFANPDNTPKKFIHEYLFNLANLIQYANSNTPQETYSLACINNDNIGNAV